MHIFARAPGVVSADVDGEFTLLEPSSGIYFGLEHVGAEVWALLERPHTLAALVDALTAQFEVGPGECASDVSALLDQLVARGLVSRG